MFTRSVCCCLCCYVVRHKQILISQTYMYMYRYIYKKASVVHIHACKYNNIFLAHQNEVYIYMYVVRAAAVA